MGKDLSKPVIFGEQTISALEFIHRALQASGVSIFENNFKTGRVSGTRDIYLTLGYTDEEIPDTITGVTRFIHPDDVTQVLEAYAQHIENPSEKYSAEFRMRSKDGQWHWVEGFGEVTHRDEQGQPVILTGVTMFISHRKPKQQQLHQNMQMYSRAEEIAGTGSWMTDYSFAHTCWSDNKYRLLGMEPNACEPTAENYLACVHPDDRNEFNRVTHAFEKSFGKTLETRHRIIRKNDNQERIILKKWEGKRDEEGNLLLIHGVIQDITHFTANGINP